MCSVHDHTRKNSFHPSLPACLTDATAYRIFRCSNMILHNLDCFQRKHTVHNLILCYKRYGKCCISIILILKQKINARHCVSEDLRILSLHFIARTAKFLCSLTDDLCCLRIVAVIDYRYSRHNDASLFACNRSNRVSQILHMVKTDRCDHTCQRMFYRSRCVQFSTESCLKDHVIHTCVGKYHHSHQKQEFKIRRMITALCNKFICELFYFFKGMQKSIIFNIFFIDLKSLIDRNKMRRSK